MHRIAITEDGSEDGREVSHLAVRYDAPEGGPAAPLCLLYMHGFGSEQSGEKAEFFRERALAAGFAFCSFDFQGHGLSGGSLRDLTLSRNLADAALVHGWLRDQGHERLCLIGSSMGGGTALWYAARHSGRAEAAGAEGAAEIVAALHLAPALDLERGLLAWAGPERARVWEETGVIHFQNAFVSCELGWCLIEDLRRFPAEDLLARYRTPTLLIQGKRDDSVLWQSVADFAVRCVYEGIELHLFADGDHRLTDRKARLWNLMLEFLHGRGVV